MTCEHMHKDDPEHYVCIDCFGTYDMNKDNTSPKHPIAAPKSKRCLCCGLVGCEKWNLHKEKITATYGGGCLEYNKPKSKGCGNCGHEEKYHGKVNHLVDGKGENCKMLLNDGKPCSCKKFSPECQKLQLLPEEALEQEKEK